HAHPELPSFPTRRSSDLLDHRPRLRDVMQDARAVNNVEGDRWRDEGRGLVHDQRMSLEPVEGLYAAGQRDVGGCDIRDPDLVARSEEHTSELQSRENLVC